MKIAIDMLRGKCMSGNEVYTIELTKALVRDYADDEFRAIIYLNKKRESEGAISGVPNVRYLNVLPHELILGRQFMPAVLKFSALIKARVASGVDIYHCTNPLFFPFGVRNAVVTLHDLISLRPEPWTSVASRNFYRQNIGKILREAKVLFAVSDYTRIDAEQHFPDIAGKFVITPLAANPVFRQMHVDREFLTRYGVANPQKPFLLYVGEIQPRKNVEGMLKAFKAMPARLRKEYQIIVIGSARKDNYSSFERAMTALQPDSEIYHFEDVPVEDLVKFYNTAFAFVYLSFFEGFGLPVIEAMSCGCPVLTSSTTSIAEVAGGAALTVDPSDEDAVMAGLHELLTDEALRLSLVEKGVGRSRDFSWKKTAELTMEGYKRALMV